MGQHVRQTPPLRTYPVRLPSMGCSGPVKDGMPYNRGWEYGYRWDSTSTHDDVIYWKHFPRYWPFVRGTHRLPVNSPHKGQWHGALMTFSLICASVNGWVNNREAGDLRRHHAHYDVTVKYFIQIVGNLTCPEHSHFSFAQSFYKFSPRTAVILLC